jgi:hypothetical protein
MKNVEKTHHTSCRRPETRAAGFIFSVMTGVVCSRLAMERGVEGRRKRARTGKREFMSAGVPLRENGVHRKEYSHK